MEEKLAVKVSDYPWHRHSLPKTHTNKQTNKQLRDIVPCVIPMVYNGFLINLVWIDSEGQRQNGEIETQIQQNS